MTSAPLRVAKQSVFRCLHAGMGQRSYLCCRCVRRDDAAHSAGARWGHPAPRRNRPRPRRLRRRPDEARAPRDRSGRARGVAHV
eukprot:792431-Pyramimonas_sp.AAC.1